MTPDLENLDQERLDLIDAIKYSMQYHYLQTGKKLEKIFIYPYQFQLLQEYSALGKEFSRCVFDPNEYRIFGVLIEVQWPEEKVVISKKQIADAWDKYLSNLNVDVSKNSPSFKLFTKELGFK